MIATDIIQTIREQVASDLEFVREGDGRIAVYTRFMYRDGDHCGFVFARNGETGEWMITDDGEILMHAGYTGPLNAARLDRLKKTASFYGISERDGELVLPIADENKLGESFFRFSQACLDLVSAAKRMPTERKPSLRGPFLEELAVVVEEVVPVDRVSKTWYHPELDPNEVYPVDYKIDGKTRPVFLFGATTERECLRAAVTCFHYRQNQFPFMSVAVCDEEIKLSASATIPLKEAVDKTFFSFVTDREDIESLLRGEAA